MPFNIELMNKAGNTREIAIKIQVVKDRINIYFNGNKEEAITVRKHWEYLSSRFLSNMPYLATKESIFISDGIHHLKQEHTNTLERTYIHTHLPFLKEITPELLSLYLYEMYEQQKMLPEAHYQFFQGRDEVEDIMKAFSIHYDLYKGSSIEREYNECSTLTPEEQIEHEQAVETLPKYAIYPLIHPEK